MAIEHLAVVVQGPAKSTGSRFPDCGPGAGGNGVGDWDDFSTEGGSPDGHPASRRGRVSARSNRIPILVRSRQGKNNLFPSRNACESVAA